MFAHAEIQQQPFYFQALVPVSLEYQRKFIWKVLLLPVTLISDKGS